MKQVCVLLLGICLLGACQDKKEASQITKAQISQDSSKTIAKAQEEKPSMDTTLEDFWPNFQEAVSQKNIEQLAKLSQFPLMGFLSCEEAKDTTQKQDKVASMPQATPEIFKKCFDYTFDVCVLQGIAESKWTDFREEKDQDKTLYILEVKYRFISKKRDSGGMRSFVFQNQGEGIKLVAIFTTGRTGGDCEPIEREEDDPKLDSSQVNLDSSQVN